VPSREQRVKARNRTREHLTEEVRLKQSHQSYKCIYIYNGGIANFINIAKPIFF